jgi:lipoprotein NlpI
VREASNAAVGALYVSVLPLARAESFQAELKEWVKKVDRRQIKYPTDVQLRSNLAVFATTVRLDAGRLSPRNKAKVLRERAIAHDQLGDTAKALADLDAALMLSPRDADVMNSKAVVQWSAGQFSDALMTADAARALSGGETSNAVKLRTRTQYYLGDFAGAAKSAEEYLRQTTGVDRAFAWLWLDLASRSGKLAERERYKALGAEIKIEQWPMPVVKYYRGEISADELLRAARDKDESVQKSRTCEAQFYIGKRLLDAGDIAGAERAFERAKATEVLEYLEHRAAGFELARLKSRR